ncbi:MAG: hypothetical protein F6J87_08415 [Spirulina sp. SIO3F2]|nr:hypothetical protein [Spirulina sp. SIO3F2]
MVTIEIESEIPSNRPNLNQRSSPNPSGIFLLDNIPNRVNFVFNAAELLAVVQRCLPPSQQERWAILRGKLAEETLTEREHQEFLTYSDLLELWNAERVEVVMELAQLRGVEFKVLYRELTPQFSV